MSSKKIEDKGSTKKENLAEKLPTVIQSKTVTISGVGLPNFSIKIKADTTNDANTAPLAKIPVSDFDKERFAKPIIAQLKSGKSGTNQTNCDIIDLSFYPPQYRGVFSESFFVDIKTSNGLRSQYLLSLYCDIPSSI